MAQTVERNLPSALLASVPCPDHPITAPTAPSRLLQRAEELRREKEARAVKFSAGKLAYERGNYPASSLFLEQALDEEGEFTQLGGEIQLWLALAYQVRACGVCAHGLAVARSLASAARHLRPLPASLSSPPVFHPSCPAAAPAQACGREEACLSIYRSLEKTHPLPAIRRQACDLRYIMEAPKLQINPDERVQIPVLTDLDVNRWVGGWDVWVVG